MRTVCVTMVRDEADIIGHTLTHLLAQPVDLIVVADNLSTDNTRNILDRHTQTDPRVLVVDDPDPAYNQADKITALAATHTQPGDWVIPFDADELWFNLDQLPNLEAWIVEVPTRRFIPTRDLPADVCPACHIDTYVPAQDGYDGAPKICFRWQAQARILQGNHDVNAEGPRQTGPVVNHHYQYRTREQARRKVTTGAHAYAAAPTQSADNGFHWKQLAALTDHDFDQWWHDYTHTPGLLTATGPRNPCG